MTWSQIWVKLKEAGWSHSSGKGVVWDYYMIPGYTRDGAKHLESKFQDSYEVTSYLKRTYLFPIDTATPPIEVSTLYLKLCTFISNYFDE